MAVTQASGVKHGFGVDVGGSGIKGGIVDLDAGQLVGDRFKVLTPHPATPQSVASGVREVVDHFGWTGPVGITLPAVIAAGVCRTAANIDPAWIGTEVYPLFAAELGDRDLAVLNDADAAGIAEDAHGAGHGRNGVTMLLTLGTGIGSAIIQNGVLLPNTELGHLEVDGKEAEHRASSKVKEDKDWSYQRWAKEVSLVLETYEKLFWPDLFIVGGGISRKADKWIPMLTNRVPVVPAELRNNAGLVGAAMAVDTGLRP
ncbi:polyphosphate--glucose phosphotransferase [Jongsikchunia kroppenstedtii]|uniref:polyphosphate--glucose phosphotransferase n=1 Tax=Jongsikchunia kroppenstedtii TaxID=1121721 RepID=UPI00036F41CA|nr:ROK family protein [Jongsikchunia kroppenstedtii]